MTFNEFKAALKAIGMSQRGFATLVNLDQSTITKWRLQPSVPRYAEVIVDLLAKLNRKADAKTEASSEATLALSRAMRKVASEMKDEELARQADALEAGILVPREAGRNPR
jgi:hypothetical protein